jgi:hypothetical protein
MHLNKVIFIGGIGNDLKMAYQSNGLPRTAFTLIIDQPAKDGMVYGTQGRLTMVYTIVCS